MFHVPRTVIVARAVIVSVARTVIVSVARAVIVSAGRNWSDRRLRFRGRFSAILPGFAGNRGRREEGAGGCWPAGKRFERDWLLRLVRVLRANMKLELVNHLSAQLALGQHPLDR
jgi:hypothetical protein